MVRSYDPGWELEALVIAGGGPQAGVGRVPTTSKPQIMIIRIMMMIIFQRSMYHP